MSPIYDVDNKWSRSENKCRHTLHSTMNQLSRITTCCLQCESRVSTSRDTCIQLNSPAGHIFVHQNAFTYSDGIIRIFRVKEISKSGNFW